LIASVLGIVLILVLYFAGKHPLLIPIIVDYRLLMLPLFIFFAIKETRDVYWRGSLSFAQGMGLGFVVYGSIGIIVGLSLLLINHFTGGEFTQSFVDITYSQLVENREEFLKAIGEEAYLAGLEKTPLTTSLDLAFDYFIKTCALGILFTIIISVILRKQPNS